MPTYEYECDHCGHGFELFQGIKDDPEKTCPSCEQPQLRRLFGTGSAVVFKGSGFYQTDYRSESYRKAAKADGGGGDSCGGGGCGKSCESSGEAKTSPPASKATKPK